MLALGMSTGALGAAGPSVPVRATVAAVAPAWVVGDAIAVDGGAGDGVASEGVADASGVAADKGAA
jgi:hypothetical protein